MAGLREAPAADPVFWRNKKVLVTGHTGFKGAWLCLWLARMGANVSGVALPPAAGPSLFRAAKVGEVLARSILLDISDGAGLKRALQEVKPQIIFHMAAQPLVRAGYRDPSATYMTNIMGTVNLLEAVRAVACVRAVVNVTTDKCYADTGRRQAHGEQDPLGGHDPYSSSKACAEIVTAAYRRSFFQTDKRREHGVSIATARAGNVIGGGDWARDRLVPDCIRALIQGKDIVLRDPHAVRPWQHVLEPLCGYLLLAENLFTKGQAFASAWNFGPDAKDKLTVKQVTDRVVRQWGGGSRVKLSSGSHPHEAGFLLLDSSKARQGLGWRPRMSMEQAIEWTVDGYRRGAGNADTRGKILQQIDLYRDSCCAALPRICGR